MRLGELLTVTREYCIEYAASSNEIPPCSMFSRISTRHGRESIIFRRDTRLFPEFPVAADGANDSQPESGPEENGSGVRGSRIHISRCTGTRQSVANAAFSFFSNMR